ncbi:D-alanyl-lipoteichoic acid biosynthesis protein DltD [Streptococcus sciuri]|uniref:Protein DltD n=1 Tax=Streptococcus sciuri TaxID=2973939 RepID=A0ABT2F5U9_9STRE|nr:D-alanyl-lipoteichoic acid biosynthesis protein DltD [Streptococcus sciuri]MCS4487855.1 D-alanyl-lipoteichoic acid biosynthesis protein DltD [Streptococcus sciuri]
MLRRLWQILGPVVCAFLLILALLIVYPTKITHSVEEEKNDAVALTHISFKSRAKKIRALSDKKQNFVPFFGSSEWNRMDSFHPSMLAEAYNRSYTPYLLGQKGAASLTQYFGMQQISSQMRNKKAVYFISPQWFVKKGANASAFQNYFSSGQMISFLENQTDTIYDRYAAKRFLKLYPQGMLHQLVAKVSKGESLSSLDKNILAVERFIALKEDALFSKLSFSRSYQEKVVKKASHLPQPFSYKTLEKLATKIAKKSTTNNSFNIDNSFYTQRVSYQLKRLKGAQKKFSYLRSPEYNDLQLVLSQFAKNNSQVIFVIPSVNSKWIAYTGLNEEMYQKAVAKIKYQLESQGFTNIADFSKDGNKAYFMQDTIHMGWKGWLAFDKAIAPFLEEKQAIPNYHLNDAFLSKSWANYTGQLQDFTTK